MAVDLSKMRGMTEAELGQEEAALRDEIWKLRLQRSGGQSSGPDRGRQARRRLAQVLTVRREQQLVSRGDKK